MEKQVQDIANLRMQLSPYLYTSYADFAFYRTPPIRSMNLEPGFNTPVVGSGKNINSTDNLYQNAINSEIKDQFIVGDALVVAPLFAGQLSRTVILPKGK